MKDKNGTEIQDGDLLRVPEQFGESVFAVVHYANGELGLHGQEVCLSELVPDVEVVTPNV